LSGLIASLPGVSRLITELLLALWGLRPATDPPPRVLFER
jgi:hypothetical protein